MNSRRLMSVTVSLLTASRVATACEDNVDFRDAVYQESCAQWASYLPCEEGYDAEPRGPDGALSPSNKQALEALLASCPVTCGSCETTTTTTTTTTTNAVTTTGRIQTLDTTDDATINDFIVSVSESTKITTSNTGESTSVTACEDDPNFRDGVYQETCVEWAKYLPCAEGYATETDVSDEAIAELLAACPVSCQMPCSHGSITKDIHVTTSIGETTSQHTTTTMSMIPCKDSDTFVDNLPQGGYSCSDWIGYCDDDVADPDRRSRRSVCEDDPDFRDVVYQESCAQWASYLPCEEGYDAEPRGPDGALSPSNKQALEALLASCPVTCGSCETTTTTTTNTITTTGRIQTPGTTDDPNDTTKNSTSTTRIKPLSFTVTSTADGLSGMFTSLNNPKTTTTTASRSSKRSSSWESYCKGGTSCDANELLAIQSIRDNCPVACGVCLAGEPWKTEPIPSTTTEKSTTTERPLPPGVTSSSAAYTRAIFLCIKEETDQSLIAAHGGTTWKLSDTGSPGCARGGDELNYGVGENLLGKIRCNGNGAARLPYKAQSWGWGGTKGIEWTYDNTTSAECCCFGDLPADSSTCAHHAALSATDPIYRFYVAAGAVTALALLIIAYSAWLRREPAVNVGKRGEGLNGFDTPHPAGLRWHHLLLLLRTWDLTSDWFFNRMPLESVAFITAAADAGQDTLAIQTASLAFCILSSVFFLPGILCLILRTRAKDGHKAPPTEVNWIALAIVICGDLPQVVIIADYVSLVGLEGDAVVIASLMTSVIGLCLSIGSLISSAYITLCVKKVFKFTPRFSPDAKWTSPDGPITTSLRTALTRGIASPITPALSGLIIIGFATFLPQLFDVGEVEGVSLCDTAALAGWYTTGTLGILSWQITGPDTGGITRCDAFFGDVARNQCRTIQAFSILSLLVFVVSLYTAVRAAFCNEQSRWTVRLAWASSVFLAIVWAVALGMFAVSDPLLDPLTLNGGKLDPDNLLNVPSDSFWVANPIEVTHLGISFYLYAVVWILITAYASAWSLGARVGTIGASSSA